MSAIGRLPPDCYLRSIAAGRLSGFPAASQAAERRDLMDSCLTAFGRKSAIAAVEASLSKRQLANQFPTFSFTQHFPKTGPSFILLPAGAGATDIGDFRNQPFFNSLERL